MLQLKKGERICPSSLFVLFRYSVGWTRATHNRDNFTQSASSDANFFWKGP